MQINHLIIITKLCILLLSIMPAKQLLSDISKEISLIDTKQLEPELKLFFDKFYQKNYSGDNSVKRIKSIQFLGTYYENGEEIGTIKLIKKRPNKYKSHLRKKDNSEEIFVFNGKSFYTCKKAGANLSNKWKKLDTNSSKNLWIHYEQLFDSPMLYPDDPDKNIFLGKAHNDNGTIIQPVTIELKSNVKVTNFISINDNLIKKSTIQINNTRDLNSTTYTIFYENYESINGVHFPKKIITKFKNNETKSIEFHDIKFNLGISDFFFNDI